MMKSMYISQSKTYIDSRHNMLLTYRHEILTYDVEAHIIPNFSLYKHRH
jgi:hypothetical protein